VNGDWTSGGGGGASDEATFTRLRREMVHWQLQRRGITDTRVLEAMDQVPRHRFVPPSERAAAYEDRALPLSSGQTISQPFTVAFMCQELRLAATDKVLEIGTGSGYAAAVLSQLARRVHTIERIASLAEWARDHLLALGYQNVIVHLGDGTLGLPEEAPFDAIVATAGGIGLPVPLREQLADGGRIVIPLQNPAGGQTMWRFTRRGHQWLEEDLGRFAFVPLVGKFGWTEFDGVQ
jgi:protein-L-isoaspartate(D-aspartate) O-methyltransferase